MAETILVGCKLPHGLNLDLRDAQGNITARVKLPGNSGFTLPNPDRKFKNPTTVYGDTFTEVEKDHWDAWLKKHKTHPAVVNGAIYAASQQEDAIVQARNHEDENVGFNKIDPKRFGVSKMDDSSKPAGA